jgi:transcriptional regulator with XRE-family HTH domain
VKRRNLYPNLKLTIYSSGLKQNRIAELAGIDQAHLSRIINGVREPGEQTRTQLANILGCDQEWLFQRITWDDSTPGEWDLKSPGAQQKQ